jgi:dipeptide transport system permease protein
MAHVEAQKTEVVDQAVAVKRRSGLSEFWFYFSQNKGAVIGLFVFLVIVALAVLAPVLAPHDPTLQNRGALLVPPFWQEGGSTDYLLGTDPVAATSFRG